MSCSCYWPREKAPKCILFPIPTKKQSKRIPLSPQWEILWEGCYFLWLGREAALRCPSQSWGYPSGSDAPGLLPVMRLFHLALGKLLQGLQTLGRISVDVKQASQECGPRCFEVNKEGLQIAIFEIFAGWDETQNICSRIILYFHDISNNEGFFKK